MSGYDDRSHGIGVRGFIEIGSVPAFDRPRVSSGGSIEASALPSSSGTCRNSRSRLYGFGQIDAGQNQQGIERVLSCLMRPHASGAANYIGIRTVLPFELEDLVRPAQPPASDDSAIRRRQGLALRPWRRARHQERLLLCRGGPEGARGLRCRSGDRRSASYSTLPAITFRRAGSTDPLSRLARL